MSQYKRLWIALVVVVAASFAVLGYFVLGLITGHSYTKAEPVSADEPLLTLPCGVIHATATD